MRHTNQHVALRQIGCVQRFDNASVLAIIFMNPPSLKVAHVVSFDVLCLEVALNESRYRTKAQDLRQSTSQAV